MTVLRYIDEVAISGSIRRAAEKVNITPSALTRKIQDFEHELGAAVFERLPHGMRLNAAGELLIRHIRGRAADFERVQSQIADLSGLRRGHVSIVCSQAFADRLLPAEIDAYRQRHKAVSFLAQVRDHAQGIAALASFEADLALLVHPPAAAEMQTLLTGRQTLCAFMRRDHKLAAEGPVRLRDCFAHKVALPTVSIAIRRLLDEARGRAMLEMDLQVESSSLELLRNTVLREHLVSFQLPIGIPAATPELVARPVDEQDVAAVPIVLGQLRGRSLSVAAAKFVEQLAANPIWEAGG